MRGERPGDIHLPTSVNAGCHCISRSSVAKHTKGGMAEVSSSKIRSLGDAPSKAPAGRRKAEFCGEDAKDRPSNVSSSRKGCGNMMAQTWTVLGLYHRFGYERRVCRK